MLAGGGTNTAVALAALVDSWARRGDGVPQSGGRLELIRQRADKVRAFIDIEGSCGPLSPDDVEAIFRKVPDPHGVRRLYGRPQRPHRDERRNVCNQSVGAINAAADRQVPHLPGLGIKGNSHADDGQEQHPNRRPIIAGRAGTESAKK
jgi:hypothetical protein